MSTTPSIMRLLKFMPLYQSRVWGGRKLHSDLGRKLPDDGPIGESWEIVDRPEAQSIELQSGRTLRELLMTHSLSIMGPDWKPERPFPILVKWLDCSRRLSLQVHPPAAVAEKLGGEPKTECWFIAQAAPEAALIVGLRQGATRRHFENAIENENLEPLLHRFPVQSGQAMLLASSRLHAIDAGNLILEIQQNSDTTYRVYDWGRKGLDGQPRQLHVEQSLQSIDFSDIEPNPLPAFTELGQRTIADCKEFRIRQLNLAPGQTLEFQAGDQPRILSLVSGRLQEACGNEVIANSESVLIPFCAEVSLIAKEATTALITENFGCSQ